MESIESVRATNLSRFDALVEAIRDNGTDNLSHFKNGYRKEGGYSLQQNPFELAALTMVLEKYPHKVYLEIGTASGGTMRFLHEYALSFEVAYSIDDHGHHRWPEQEKNFREMLLPEPARCVLECYVGDSHTDDCKRWLSQRDRRLDIDVAFVDGDHRYEGVRQDIELVLPYLAPCGLLVLHDIIACAGDVGRAWREVVASRRVEPVAELIGAEVPLGIAVGRVR